MTTETQLTIIKRIAKMVGGGIGKVLQETEWSSNEGWDRIVNMERYWLTPTVAIYELIDPRTDKCFYVGKTCQRLSDRLSAHILESRNGIDTYKCRVIRKIVAKGLHPLLIEIDRVPYIEQDFWERWYIQLYRGWNIQITNATKGGDGGRISNAAIEKMRRTKQRRYILGEIAPWNKGKQGVQVSTRKGTKQPPRSQEIKDRISHGLKKAYAEGKRS